MVEIYDIMNITCQNLYHMPYQSSTYITPRAGGPWGDIGFSGWYGMWYRYWHVIFSIYAYFTTGLDPKRLKDVILELFI